MAQPTQRSEWPTGADDAGRRLDRVLRRVLKSLPLAAIYGALRRGRIVVNGHRAEPDYRIAAGDRIGLDPDIASLVERRASPGPSVERTESEDMASLAPLLLLATDDLLFLNKPAGDLVHGPDSIEERVRRALRQTAARSLGFSPGPLHRLDRNTSGLIVFPRSVRGAQVFSACLRERSLKKHYLALLEGKLSRAEVWEDNLERDRERRLTRVVSPPSGRPALTRAAPLFCDGRRTLALLAIETGITHQIRAQSAARRLPLLGDAKYGGTPSPEGYLLHALSIEFDALPLPDLPRRVVAPLPSTAWSRLERLFPGIDLKSIVEQADRP